jgi:hypothetical protein
MRVVVVDLVLLSHPAFVVAFFAFALVECAYVRWHTETVDRPDAAVGGRKGEEEREGGGGEE